MDLIIRDLGQQPYEPTYERMQRFTDARTAETPDELWVLEHPPVFTQGQAGKDEHLLMPGDIPVVKINRGGQVTYHGPGQLVIYPMLDLRRLSYGVRDLVNLIEHSLIHTLADFGLDAYAKPDAPGVYLDQVMYKGHRVDGAKIAALGLRIRNGRSMHGLSFNLDMDLTPFDRINPCGYAGLPVTQLCDVCPDITVADARAHLIDHLVERLGHTSLETRQGWS